MRRIALTVSVTINQLVKQIQVLVMDLVSIIFVSPSPQITLTIQTSAHLVIMCGYFCFV